MKKTSKQWLLIERAYGECEISCHNTKKAAMIYGGYMASTRISTGVYEIHERHLVCKKEDAMLMGYEL